MCGLCPMQKLEGSVGLLGACHLLLVLSVTQPFLLLYYDSIPLCDLVTIFSDGYLGSSNDEGRSEVC